MKKISGSEKLNQVSDKQNKLSEILGNLGIKITDDLKEKSLVEIAKKHQVPLQVLLNNIAKGFDMEVEWPKVAGWENDFSASTGLRKGKPEGIKKVIAVHSGKGGVGKTFVATTLANFLADQGKKVGLLDLDIDCPNIMKALGVSGKILANKDRKIVPLEYRGIKVVSMGGIQEREDAATLWRGPIVAKAIEQLVQDTEWGDLDILIVDFPPGTGEAPLTLFNLFKTDGVVIVTTPQPTALADASKSVDMCRNLSVPIIGVIENMCGDIFGEAEAGKIEKNWNVKYLGAINLKKDYVQPQFWESGFDANLSHTFANLEKLLFS